MIPPSISASSILVSEACMMRWRAENFYKTPQASSEPANIGTACHYALEHFVEDVYLKGIIGWDDVKHLTTYYQLGYIETFNSTDFDTDAYKDGATLVANWYERNKEGLPNKVLSVEKKETFPVSVKHNGQKVTVPFTYIYDRLDQIDDNVFEVVDYKSIRLPHRPEDLRKKIQPRAYALAAQIKFPEAERIYVSFDMLRHDGPVGVAFTREENAATYRYIQRALLRILETDEDAVEETLNDECKWCIRKVSCQTLAKANAVGTVHGMSIEDIARRKAALSAQVLAIKYAEEELDKALVAEAEHRGEIEFEAGDFEVNITARSMRKPNSNAIIQIIGPELASKYGNMTMTNVDKMLKSGELSVDQVKAIQNQIDRTWSSPSAKVKPKNPF